MNRSYILAIDENTVAKCFLNSHIHSQTIAIAFADFKRPECK